VQHTKSGFDGASRHKAADWLHNSRLNWLQGWHPLPSSAHDLCIFEPGCDDNAQFPRKRQAASGAGGAGVAIDWRYRLSAQWFSGRPDNACTIAALQHEPRRTL